MFLIVIVLALVLASPASAAWPVKHRSYQAHDHATPGKQWHVQLDAAPRSRRLLKVVVVYAQKCDATVAQENVPVFDDGTVTVRGKVKGGGAWQLDAQFTSPDVVEGTWRVRKGRCDTGVLPFSVKPLPPGTHNHGAKFPDLASATVRQTRQAIQMRHRVFRARNELFPTFQAAHERGFTRLETSTKLPFVFHLRKSSYVHDDRIFDAWRPESLVYWWPVQGEPVLIGTMFRVPSGLPPEFAGPIPIYHQHASRFGGLGKTQMTHVWLTGDLKSAWSNCLPIKELEAANPAFRYQTPGTAGSGPESTPC